MTTDIKLIVERLETEEDMIPVPRAVLASASSAIDKKRDGAVTLALLRHYALQPAPATTEAAALLPMTVIGGDLSDEDIQAFVEAQMTSPGGEIVCWPRFVWVRTGDSNRASDCTLDGDEAREWIARGLMVVTVPVFNVQHYGAKDPE